jgi:cytoskeletal protein CcmA (bactofilin family)
MAYASVIGSSAVIRGNVRGDSSLEILGRVEGDVGVTGDLSLGREAVVLGAISGARILIGGSVQGDVTGTEAVLIAETGRVVGDLSAPRIGMSEGAQVRGSVRTDGNAGAPASPRGSAQRERAAEPRPAAAPVERSAVERPAPRPQPVHQAAAQRPANSAAGVQMAASPKPAFKKQPPPPVITAPRPGVRARKKLARR